MLYAFTEPFHVFGFYAALNGADHAHPEHSCGARPGEDADRIGDGGKPEMAGSPARPRQQYRICADGACC